MKNIKIIIYLFAVIFLTGCFKEPQIVKIQTIEMLQGTSENIEVDAVSLVENPNNYKIEASSIKMQFYIGDKNIGNGIIDKTVSLKKKSISPVKIKSFLNVEDIMEYIPMIMKKDSFPVDIIVKAKFTSMKMPVKRKFTKYFDAQEIINGLISEKTISENIKIKKIKMIKPAVDKTVLKILLEFSNPIPINYSVEKISLSVYDNKNKENLLGSSDSDKHFTAGSKSKIDIPFTVKMNNINMAKTMFSKFFKMDNKFFLSGKFNVSMGGNDFEIPINKEIEAQLPKF